MFTLGTVRSGLTTEVVALHNAGGPFTFAGADDVNILNAFKHADIHSVAGLAIGGVLQADFREVTLRPTPGLGGTANAGRC